MPVVVLNKYICLKMHLFFLNGQITPLQCALTLLRLKKTSLITFYL